MKKHSYIFYYDFNPVGQGLFATGNVRCCVNNTVLFNWVYDCGSTDSPAALDREIDAYIRSLDGRDYIDFFIISHLDRDHINGVAQILKRVRIDKLFLPYMPLVERIEIALSQAVTSPDALRYAADPAGYLAEIGGENLGEVVFVVGEDGEGPVQPDEGEPPPPDIQNISNILRPKYIDPPESSGDSLSVSSGKRISARYTTARAPLSIPGLWEFVFFNEAFDAADASLTAEVNERINDALQSNGYFDDAEQLIDDLKDIYEARFPNGNQRNDISLVTYSGPVSSWRVDPDIDLIIDLSRLISRWCPKVSSEIALLSQKPSTLYFGDITLRKRRLDKIKSRLGDFRWGDVAVAQIAHHGSVRSWFQNAAAAFNHIYSVYSYGLHNSYKHPGKDVIDDFQKRSQTLLVNEHQGAKFIGAL